MTNERDLAQFIFVQLGNTKTLYQDAKYSCRYRGSQCSEIGNKLYYTLGRQKSNRPCGKAETRNKRCPEQTIQMNERRQAKEEESLSNPSAATPYIVEEQTGNP